MAGTDSRSQAFEMPCARANEVRSVELLLDIFRSLPRSGKNVASLKIQVIVVILVFRSSRGCAWGDSAHIRRGAA